ncbi:MAG: hypothetical protein FWD33_02045 [Alphaproteobacteria bacterium]|nr:hypothetical protein [Alphaproteobacteria bacterium]
MFNVKLYFIVLCLLFAATPLLASQASLSASRTVDVTAENAVAAKNRATIEARRSLSAEIIRRHATESPDTVDAALEGFTDADAQVLVKSTSIENERFSATSYNATITINLDRQALARWFARNGLEYASLSDDTAAGWTAVYFNLPEGLNQWKWLNVKLREAGVQNRAGMQIFRISGNQIFGKVPDTTARNFAANLRKTGAIVYNIGGALRVSLPPELTRPEQQ